MSHEQNGTPSAKVNSDNCEACLQKISAGASRCPHCGSFIKKWRRYVLNGAALIAAFLVVVPLWDLAANTGGFIAGVWDKEVDFEVEGITCFDDQFHISILNRERRGDRDIRVQSVRLMDVGGGKYGQNLVFGTVDSRTNIVTLIPAGQTRNQTASIGLFNASVPPLPCEVCNVRLAITLAELDGTKASTKTVSCQYIK